MACLNKRSSFHVMGDMGCHEEGWEAPSAVALSILATGHELQSIADGVTVLPTPAFAALMKVIMARKVNRLHMHAIYDPTPDNLDGRCAPAWLTCVCVCVCYVAVCTAVCLCVCVSVSDCVCAVMVTS